MLRTAHYLTDTHHEVEYVVGDQVRLAIPGGAAFRFVCGGVKLGSCRSHHQIVRIDHLTLPFLIPVSKYFAVDLKNMALAAIA